TRTSARPRSTPTCSRRASRASSPSTTHLPSRQDDSGENDDGNSRVRFRPTEARSGRGEWGLEGNMPSTSRRAQPSFSLLSPLSGDSSLCSQPPLSTLCIGGGGGL